jgi:hypothetical protein
MNMKNMITKNYLISLVILVFLALSSNLAFSSGKGYRLAWDEVTHRIDGTPVEDIFYEVKSGDYSNTTIETSSPLPNLLPDEACVRAVEGIIPSAWSCAKLTSPPNKPVIRIVISID